MDERYRFMSERKPALKEFYLRLERYDWQQLEPLLRFGRAIADPARLKILGILACAASSEEELAHLVLPGKPSREIERHVNILMVAGLIRGNQQRYELNRAGLEHFISLLSFEALSQQVLLSGEARSPDTPTQEEQQKMAITAYFKEERLLALPNEQSVRRSVLEHIAQRFERARTYPEKEVNDLLKPLEQDVASLRRSLVDEGFLQREHGIYRRVG